MIAKYASVVAGSPERNQLRIDPNSPSRDGRMNALTDAVITATSALTTRLAMECASTFVTRTGRRSGNRSPIATIAGDASASTYHCGASATNARQIEIGR